MAGGPFDQLNLPEWRADPGGGESLVALADRAVELHATPYSWRLTRLSCLLP